MHLGLGLYHLQLTTTHLKFGGINKIKTIYFKKKPALAGFFILTKYSRSQIDYTVVKSNLPY